ncbi:Cell surface spherulin 4-like protein, putative [Penicillium digitatum]|uniref:Cell surface spherulin 4-like protein, putative n=3 Tax=Penicillium digitatum TaxID=36651 RepID=K9F4J6_PEND2|nr:Cell surface spherulin 4-like protein, putative [Penicillium digitatum Pd1]EKV04240.1 Cell surface spherulin 4-like protein, putative [Penicillium digitatum PHI26]EKV21390.1 Cell surface spherulin 4-like protein, putative [Penicillium digitatum Pd1]KAG0154301.1 hypothetical protein PDIDSM_1681 [Penicillium digitatum]QQK47962.1 Cell surface spherulin 4-like protein, putative [Penicillium digitatum]
MSDPEKHVSKRTCLKSKRSRFLAIVLLIVIIAAVIPSVVVTTLRKKNNMGPKAKVFVPLYVYPAPEAWAPLENVISTHPEVNFTVVINPGNGPGPDSLPDGNYTREIPKLNAYANVRLLGYVYTSYGKRDVSAVREDIQTYADWPTNSSNPNLAVRGIFFDETPQQYDAQTMTYLQGLKDFVKDRQDLGPDRFVVHNPGAIPDSRYLATADSTVVFEAAYTTFQERHGAKLFTNIADSNRTQLCAIVHSVPEAVEGNALRSLVKQVRKVADEVYITHLSTDYYASFGSRWIEFVNLMAE